MLSALLFITVVQPTDVVIDARIRKPISPYIYGVNHPDFKKMGPGITLARQGGNRMTAYNWETNASNAGSDWHHQNDGYLGESNVSGWTAKTFLDAGQQNGAAVLLTIPTAGYVSADKNGDGDVNKTPNYLDVRFHKSLARKGRPFAYPPDTKDRSVYQDEFVAWLQKTKSPKTPVWYSLDNEPDLWGHTHERIWAKNPTYAQIISNNKEFASAIKDVAPKSLVFGPANYGWMGFRRFQGAPDANNRDFLDVYLAAMKDAERAGSRRLLDVLDIHWYPEAKGDGVRICFNDGKSDKPGTNAARIQAPRSLWDPSYVEDSWITQSLQGKAIALLPGILGQISKQYPGTKLAITEYNYGGANHISGAIAQADVLGIFGRYGVFAACNWGLNADNRAELAGFRSFANYDGKGSRFGDLGLQVSGTEAASISVYASLDSKHRGQMTIVAINKKNEAMPFSATLEGFTAKSVTGYVVEGSEFSVHQAKGASIAKSRVKATLPALSVTTFLVR